MDQRFIRVKHGVLRVRLPLLMAIMAQLLAGCTLTNLQLDETNVNIDAISQQIEDSRVSTGVVLEKLALLDERQKRLEGQLDLVLSGVDNVAVVQQSVQKSLKPVLPAPTQAIHAEETKGVDKVVLGRAEWLWLSNVERYVAAKLNTSLEFSVLFASDIVHFERDGKRWLRFSVERNEWPSVIEAPVERSEKFSQVGANSIKGPVVTLPVRLSSFNDALEFVVVTQKKSYPQVVLGKNFLTDIAIVDVSEKYTQKKSTELSQAEQKAKRLYEDRLAEKIAQSVAPESPKENNTPP